MRARSHYLALVALVGVAMGACGGANSDDSSAAVPADGLAGDGGANANALGGDGGSGNPGSGRDGATSVTSDDAGPPHPAVTGLTQFTDVTSSSGLATVQTGVSWTFDHAIEDFDGDGKLDIFLGDHEPGGNRLAHNDGNGSFSNKLGTLTSITGVWSFSAVDVNDDGAIDAIVNWDSQNTSAFINNSSGGFTTASSPFDHQANGEAWADYDGDGALDFVVTNFNGTNRVWHHKNASGVSSSDFTETSGTASGKASASVYLADVNGDHRPDLVMQVLTNGSLFEPATGCSTKVALNTGSGFGSPSTAGLDNAPCYGISLGDFDNDGDLDLVAVGAAAAGSSSAGTGNTNVGIGLFRNAGDGTFTDVTSAAGLPTTTTKVDVYRHIYDQALWADVDQDGYLDLIATVGSTDRVFRNLGNRTFEDDTSTWKLNAGDGRPERMAAGDIDGDGDIDLVTQSGQASGFHLWRNDLGSNRWLTVRLAGNAIKTAVSSKISLYEAGHANDAAYLRGYREVMVSTSHRTPLEQTFSTEDGKTYDVVARFWPAGTVVTVPNVTPGKRLQINESGSSSNY